MTACCGLDVAVFGHQACALAADSTPLAYLADWCPPACWRQHHLPIDEALKLAAEADDRRRVTAGA